MADLLQFSPIDYRFLAQLQWRRGRGGGQGGAMAPPIVETRRKIVNVVGNCQSCRRGERGDLKCCRPENFLVCRKNFRFAGKVLPLAPPKTLVPRRHCPASSCPALYLSLTIGLLISPYFSNTEIISLSSMYAPMYLPKGFPQHLLFACCVFFVSFRFCSL